MEAFVMSISRCFEALNRALRKSSSQTMSPARENENDPVLLGVLTDIQYADKENKKIGKVSRNYRAALSKTERAVTQLNESEVSAVLHLGDIVDGNSSAKTTHADLDCVLTSLSHLNVPVFHVLGNHCLWAERRHLFSMLRLGREGYYSQNLSPLWRLIVLDTVDVSVRRTEHPLHKRQAEQYLIDHKGEANAKKWNGGLGKSQLEWLERTLKLTASEGRLAIVCGHIPIVAKAAVPDGVIYDNRSVERLLSSHSGCVKAYFCGHHHAGGYEYETAIHHVTFEGVLDADHEDGAFGVIELHKTRIVIDGKGTMTSRVLAI